MTVLTDWIAAVCAELGVDRDAVDERVILDLARDAAHQVDRPAAPVTAFLLGIAVGGGQPLTATADRLSALAAAWPGNRPKLLSGRRANPPKLSPSRSVDPLRAAAFR